MRGSRTAVQAAVAVGWMLRIDTGSACHLVNDEGFELEIVVAEDVGD